MFASPFVVRQVGFHETCLADCDKCYYHAGLCRREETIVSGDTCMFQREERAMVHGAEWMSGWEEAGFNHLQMLFIRICLFRLVWFARGQRGVPLLSTSCLTTTSWATVTTTSTGAWTSLLQKSCPPWVQRRRMAKSWCDGVPRLRPRLARCRHPRAPQGRPELYGYSAVVLWV